MLQLIKQRALSYFLLFFWEITAIAAKVAVFRRLGENEKI